MNVSTYVRRAAQKVNRIHTPPKRRIYTPPKKYPTYTPPSMQAVAFHQSQADIRAIFGGDRAGKSHPGGYEIIDQIRKNPGKLFWTGALTQEKISNLWNIHKKFLSPEELAYIDKNSTWYSRKRGMPAFWEHPNGAKHAYKSFRAGAGLWASDEVYGIHLDEDPERVTTEGEQIYNDCLSRIISCNGRIWITATPVLGKNWMYERIFQYNAKNREDFTPDTDIEHWTAALLDNIFINGKQKRKARGRMSSDEIQRRFYGAFTSLQGAVFKEWREDLSVLREFPRLPFEYRRAAGIDLGFDHPFACVWGAYDGDGNLYIYDEYMGSGYTAIHANEIRAHEQYATEHYHYGSISLEARDCDHDLQVRKDLEYNGIITSPASKADKALNILMANRLMMGMNGRTKLFIAPWCYQLITQIGKAHYKKNTTGKDEMYKLDDDLVDAFLYLVAHFVGKANFDVDDILTSSADDYL